MQSNNFLSVLLGFTFALCNKFFGWMNIVLDIHWTNFWFDCLQAIITGAIGAASAWVVNILLKKFEKYYKKKKNGRYRTTSY